MARTARNGLMFLNDRYGRMVASTRTTDALRTLQGTLPLGPGGGRTVYDAIGDASGWLCLLAGVTLALWPRRLDRAVQAEREASLGAAPLANQARL